MCINHQIGIALFLDSTLPLAFGLHLFSSSEISLKDKDDTLLLAQESYSLLERLAWTLPLPNTEGSVHQNWAWNVVTPLVETTLGWLTAERVASVCEGTRIRVNGPEQEFGS